MSDRDFICYLSLREARSAMEESREAMKRMKKFVKNYLC
jgi:hypothetical protein